MCDSEFVRVRDRVSVEMCVGCRCGSVVWMRMCFVVWVV